MTYAALFLMITWADAELAFRGRGPPPVPSRMSLVLMVWLWVLYGCDNAATKVAVPVKNARRLKAGMWRPEAESYGHLYHGLLAARGESGLSGLAAMGYRASLSDS